MSKNTYVVKVWWGDTLMLEYWTADIKTADKEFSNKFWYKQSGRKVITNNEKEIAYEQW